MGCVFVQAEERQRERELQERSEREKEFVVHVPPLPDDEEIEKMVLEKKKKELPSKYTSGDGLLEEQTEAKQMLNIQR
ncbi:unnamed protein product [Prunus armeniaca]|uniref:Uncharacterized protein n=1 Tax=Prunus armeniaca TaxID=36596 RepID=A0A6J5XTY6_PRUAR|nr:unnamed protein product [Prunus armeniaca]